MTDEDQKKMSDLHDQWILEQYKQSGLPPLKNIITLVAASLEVLRKIQALPEEMQWFPLVDHDLLSTASNQLDMRIAGHFHQEDIIDQTLKRME